MTKDNINIDKSKQSVKDEMTHLKNVIDRLNLSLANSVMEKKILTEYLLEYRKNLIEENKFDEDKPQDAIDQELYVKEQALKASIKKINETEELIENPYFGKINYTEGKLEDEIYIGKFGYIDEKTYDPLVIDWRAPVASLFYHGGLGKASYWTPSGKTEANINNRRQFIIKRGELKGMFDTELEVRDEILQYVLSSSSSDKLKDIIMTIQREQDEIIRFRRDGAVIVNGVAGSGKTTVALHRIAYLIYNNKSSLSNNVLILGPNNIFMEYISQVLPTLGENSVKQNTIWDFVREAFGEEVEVVSQEDFIESIMSGDDFLYKDAKHKRSIDYKLELVRYAALLEKELYPAKDFVFLNEVLMSKEEFLKTMEEDFKYMPLIKRAKRIKKILIDRMRYRRNLELKEINRKYRNLEKDVVSGKELNNEDTLTRREAIRNLINKVLEFREEIIYLGKGSIKELYLRQNTMRILTQEDLIPMLYLRFKLIGVKIPYRIKYLVMDEAQDISISHFLMLFEITGCKDMTLVGDINQRLVTYDGEETFIDLNKYLSDTTNFNLTTSYRSTVEIINHANEFLINHDGESLRNGDKVKIVDVDSSILEDEILKQYEIMKLADMEYIAIITRDIDLAEKIHGLIKNKINHKFIKSEDGLYNSKTLLLSAYLSKGLEFDGVIIVDDKPKSSKPDLLKYIMCTRALHMLCDIRFENKD